jgi:hypothetical protein
MKRRAFLSGLAAGIVLAAPAFAADVVDSIVRQLKKLGFRDVEQERTLLGRVRITARRKDGRREIIVNPKTGEILRDLWMPTSGKDGELNIIDDRGRDDGGKGGDDDDKDDDDDHDDDHGDDDNSGKGGGNSGHGGGGDDDD